MEIYKEFAFDAAHFLPNVPEGHKCKNIHGHTYHLRVYVKGIPGEHTGWIIDFKELKPEKPFLLFVNRINEGSYFNNTFQVNDLFLNNVTGTQTGNDNEKKEREGKNQKKKYSILESAD